MKNQQEIATPKSLSVNANDANSISQKNKQSPTKKITYLATFTALSLVLKIFANKLSPIPSLSFNFHCLMWYMAADILDPLSGGFIALLTDVFGQLISARGGFAPNPIIAAGNFGLAFSFGLVFKYLPIKSESLRAVVAGLVSACVGTLGLNTLGLYEYYGQGMPYLAYLVTRLPQLIVVAVNVLLFCRLRFICKRLKKNLE